MSVPVKAFKNLENKVIAGALSFLFSVMQIPCSWADLLPADNPAVPSINTPVKNTETKTPQSTAPQASADPSALFFNSSPLTPVTNSTPPAAANTNGTASIPVPASSQGGAITLPDGRVQFFDAQQRLLKEVSADRTVSTTYTYEQAYTNKFTFNQLGVITSAERIFPDGRKDTFALNFNNLGFKFGLQKHLTGAEVCSQGVCRKEAVDGVELSHIDFMNLIAVGTYTEKVTLLNGDTRNETFTIYGAPSSITLADGTTLSGPKYYTLTENGIQMTVQSDLYGNVQVASAKNLAQNNAWTSYDSLVSCSAGSSCPAAGSLSFLGKFSVQTLDAQGKVVLTSLDVYGRKNSQLEQDGTITSFGYSPVVTNSTNLLYGMRRAALNAGKLYSQMGLEDFQKLAWTQDTHNFTAQEINDIIKEEALLAAKLYTPEDRTAVLLGDSLSFAFPYSLTPDSDRRWINQGIGGNRTDQVLARLDNLAGLTPEVIYLLIGVNDLAQGNTDESIMQNLAAILQKLKANHPNTQIVLESLLPINPNMKTFTFTNARIQNLNLQYAALAAAQGITFLDTHKFFADSEGNLRGDMTVEGLHLNAAGYELLQTILKGKTDYDAQGRVIARTTPDGYSQKIQYSTNAVTTTVIRPNGKVFQVQKKFSDGRTEKTQFFYNPNSTVRIVRKQSQPNSPLHASMTEGTEYEITAAIPKAASPGAFYFGPALHCPSGNCGNQVVFINLTTAEALVLDEAPLGSDPALPYSDLSEDGSLAAFMRFDGTIVIQEIKNPAARVIIPKPQVPAGETITGLQLNGLSTRNFALKMLTQNAQAKTMNYGFLISQDTNNAWKADSLGLLTMTSKSLKNPAGVVLKNVSQTLYGNGIVFITEERLYTNGVISQMTSQVYNLEGGLVRGRIRTFFPDGKTATDNDKQYVSGNIYLHQILAYDTLGRLTQQMVDTFDASGLQKTRSEMRYQNGIATQRTASEYNAGMIVRTVSQTYNSKGSGFVRANQIQYKNGIRVSELTETFTETGTRVSALTTQYSANGTQITRTDEVQYVQGVRASVKIQTFDASNRKTAETTGLYESTGTYQISIHYKNLLTGSNTLSEYDTKGVLIRKTRKEFYPGTQIMSVMEETSYVNGQENKRIYQEFTRAGVLARSYTVNIPDLLAELLQVLGQTGVKITITWPPLGQPQKAPIIQFFNTQNTVVASLLYSDDPASRVWTKLPAEKPIKR